jgi:hypothetical protein
MVIKNVSLGGWCLFKLHFKVVTIELNHDVHMDLLSKYFSTFMKGGLCEPRDLILL